MSVTWRFEIWTHPRLGTPTRIVGDVPHAGAQLVDRDDAVVDSYIDIPATREDIIFEALQIDPVTLASSKSRIIRAFRVDTDTTPPTVPDLEFTAADLTWQIAEPGVHVARISGPHIKGSVDDARVLAYDYPDNPTRARDWLWDGPNIFDNGFLENISNEIQAFYITGITVAGTFTVTFDGQTTSAVTWGSDPNTRRTDLLAALEALSNITDIDLIGEGTSTDPFEITFLDPGQQDLPTISVTASTGTPTITVEATGGFASLEGWTKSYNPLTGQENGAYNSFRVTSPDLGETGLNGSQAAVLWTSPSGAASLFSGTQVILGVTPGQRYQISLRAKSSITAQYRIVVRDLIGDTESRIAAKNVSLTAGVETLVTLEDVDIPTYLDRVLVRFAIIETPGSAFQCVVDELQVKEGLQGTTKGGIVTRLLTDLQTDHAPRTRLTWLTPSFDVTNDSSTTPWAASTLPFASRQGQQMGTHVLAGLQDLGSSWDVRPTSLTAWALDLWDADNRGTDHSADTSIAFLIGQISTGKLQHRLPAETTVTAVGADGVWTETSDADLVSAFGDIDGFIESEDWLDTTTTTAAATERLARAAANALSVQAVTTHVSGPVPFKQVDVGDTANFTLASVGKHARRVRQVTVSITKSGGWTAEWTASRIFTGESATEEALRRFLTEFERRRFERPRATPTLPAPTTPPGGTIPWLVAAADSPQAFKDVAAVTCDGLDDRATVQAILDQSSLGAEVWLAPGNYILPLDTTVTHSNGLPIGWSVPFGVKLKGLGSGPGRGGVEVTSFHNAVLASPFTGAPNNNYPAAAAVVVESLGGVEDVWIDCSTDDTDAIHVASFGSYVVIKNNNLHRCRFGISAYGGSDLWVRDNHIEQCGGALLLSMEAVSTHVFVLDNRIDSGSVADTPCITNGLAYQGAGSYPSVMHVTGNRVTKTGSHFIHLEGSIQQLWVSENYVTQTSWNASLGHGIFLEGTFIEDIFINDNSLTSISGSAIRLLPTNQSGGIQIKDNTVDCNSTASGIHVSQLLEPRIVGNSISIDSSTSHDCIELVANVDSGFIASNICKGSVNPRYGINVSAATCDDNIVIHNDLRDTFTTGKLNDAGTGTILNANPDDATYGDNYV